jgi:hypothetical protein
MLAVKLVLFTLFSLSFVSGSFFRKITPVNNGSVVGGHAIRFIGDTCDKFLTFGGLTENFPAGQVYVFNNLTWTFRLSTHTWTLLHPIQSPSARAFYSFSVNSEKNKAYLYGGAFYGNFFADITFYNDFWVFDTSCDRWSLIEQPSLNPGIRTDHQSVIIDDYLYLFGGVCKFDEEDCNDLWRYSMRENVWVQLRNDSATVTDRPLARGSFFMNVAYRYDCPSKGFTISQGEHLTLPYYIYVQRTDTWFYCPATDTFTNITSPTNNINPAVADTNSVVSLNLFETSYVVVFDGEIPGGVVDCGAPFAQKQTNVSWILNVNSKDWSILEPYNGNTIPALKRVGGDVCFGEFDLIKCITYSGGWSWQCPGAGNIYNSDIIQLCFDLL